MTIILFVTGALLMGVALGYVYRLAKRRADRMQAVIATVERRFGLTNHAPGGVRPNLSAEMGGLKTAVDVYYQSYARGGDAPSGRRPYTRVRVQLKSDPRVSVRVRAQPYQSPAEMPERNTGDAVFDAKFSVFATDEVDVALIGPAVRAAFLQADQPVSLINKLVMWVERNHTLDADRLVEAVQSCIDVAAAIDQQQGLADS